MVTDKVGGLDNIIRVSTGIRLGKEVITAIKNQ